MHVGHLWQTSYTDRDYDDFIANVDIFFTRQANRVLTIIVIFRQYFELTNRVIYDPTEF